MDVPHVWRAEDLAEVYGVDVSTVHRWERSGRVRAARRDPGGCKYWLREEVVEDLARPVEPVESEPVAAALVGELATATRRSHRRRAS